MARELYDERLHRMLQFKRPHGTNTELDWADIFIMPYKPNLVGKSDTMAYIVKVGEGSKVLFSAHVDTVHHREGKQKVLFDAKNKMYYKKDNEPLGADDGAGCWLLLEMIDAGVPGTYVFHRGEEKGGIGSSWIAANCPEFLKQFDYAIAFDRKATHSIITHQGMGRCCSDKFAQALSNALNEADLDFMYVPDDSGVYTDTAEYTDLIAECTNVSCGYYDEHSGKERLDLRHIFALRDACIVLQWHELPVVREPGDDDFVGYFDNWPSRGRSNLGRMPASPARETGLFDILQDADLYALTREDLRDIAIFDPEEFADFVYDSIHATSRRSHSMGDEEFLLDDVSIRHLM